jgi:hypothetical protein
MRKMLVCLCTIFLLFVSIATSGQVAEQFRTLVINEQSGKVAVVQLGSRMYIDLKQLVQIAHGSISYEGSRMVLDVSCASSNPPPIATESEQSTNVGLSREFARAGVEEISLLREWASALANAVQNGYPVADSWLAGYRGQAQRGLAMSSTAVSTDADRNGYQLLNNEFENVQAWSNKILEARKSMNAAKYALSPDALKDDPLSQKITSCAHFLGQMLISGKFQDDHSCH